MDSIIWSHPYDNDGLEESYIWILECFAGIKKTFLLICFITILKQDSCLFTNIYVIFVCWFITGALHQSWILID